jgi:hypothetical protein
VLLLDNKKENDAGTFKLNLKSSHRQARYEPPERHWHNGTELRKNTLVATKQKKIGLLVLVMLNITTFAAHLAG